MTRFYYPSSRAHHAYSMALDFGMEFEKRFGKWDTDSLLHLSGAIGYRICLHGESVNLLEPREGDLLKVWFSRPACAGPLAIDYFVLSCPWGEAEFALEYEGHQVLQRNGKPFHWPEREET